MRHLNNGTDHRHSKSCCDQSSPARRTITIHCVVIRYGMSVLAQIWQFCYPGWYKTLESRECVINRDKYIAIVYDSLSLTSVIVLLNFWSAQCRQLMYEDNNRYGVKAKNIYTFYISPHHVCWRLRNGGNFASASMCLMPFRQDFTNTLIHVLKVKCFSMRYQRRSLITCSRLPKILSLSNCKTCSQIWQRWGVVRLFRDS